MRAMSAMPYFFVITTIAGAGLWLSGLPHPFPVLALTIVVGSVAGFALSSIYVHTFMPWRWHSRVAAIKRLRRMWPTAR
jgi:hypothetical protein